MYKLYGLDSLTPVHKLLYTLEIDNMQVLCTPFHASETGAPPVSVTQWISSVKAEIKEKSSDIHQLQLIKLHHFKLERFKSI